MEKFSIMKKPLLALIFIFFINTLSSQSIYLTTGFGFDFKLNGNDMMVTNTDYTYTVDTSYYNNKYELVNLSLGKGIMPILGLGYNINPHFAIELNAAYFFGKPQEINYKDMYDVQYGYNSEVNYTSSFKSRSLIFSPGLIIQTNRESKLQYYLKLGGSFGISNIFLSQDINIIDGFSGASRPFTDINKKWTYNGGLSYGCNISTGINYEYVDGFNFFAELSYFNFYCKPTQGTLTEYLYDGEDKFDELKTNEKEIIFTTSYSDNDNIVESEPSKAIITKYSFNMLQFNIGFKWRLFNF